MKDLLKERILENHKNFTVKIQSQNSNKDEFNPNLFFDKIFIINLKSSKDRWEKIKTNLIQNGIYNFERQQGIYLPRVNPFKSVNPNLFQNIEAYGGKYSRDSKYILNIVGTNLAHYEIVKKSIQRNYTRILILEDDTFIQKGFLSRFVKGMRQLQNKHWDLIYLGFKKSSSTFQARRISNQLVIPFKNIRGAYGYALHSRSFPYIYKNYLYQGMELDAFYEFFMMKHRKVFAFYPQIIGHRDGMKSTITDIDWKSR